MDTNVAGLNRVYCFVNTSTYNGKTVTITDGINTWEQVVSELSCVFQIPSIPAPAKKRYTVTLHNGDASASSLYSRVIDLGFGDSIRIGLYTNDEPVTKGTIPTATSSLTGGVKVSDSASNGLYMYSSWLQLHTASSSQQGGVKIGSQMSINSGFINPANITYGTSSLSDGVSSLESGKLYCQY